MNDTWIVIVLTLVSVFLILAEIILVVMFVGVFKKAQKLEDVSRVLVDTHVRAYAMHRILVNSLVRYELHLSRWYNHSTGLNWAFDPELAAERASIEETIRKANDAAVTKKENS